MHDATEGGVLGGLLEVAVASKRDPGRRGRIPVRPEVRAVCDHVGIDPYTSISEGTLIATVVPERAEAFVDALAARGDRRRPIIGEIADRRPRAGRSSHEGARAADPPGPGSVLGRLRRLGRGRGRRAGAVPESLGTLRRRWT